MRRFAAWRSAVGTVILLPLALLIFVAPTAGQQNTPAAPQTPLPANTQTAQPATSPQEPITSNSTPQNSTTQDSTTQGSTGNDQEGMFVFKKQVEEVVLHATVVDEKRRLAAHLDQSAFSIFEDGKPQAITSFRREDVPVAMGIVVDNSGSMRDKRDKVNQAVLNLIRASNPQDEVFVVNFSQNSYLDQDFTSDISLLEHALHQASMQGSTALYDAVVASAVHLENNPRLDKKILLVITDGQDNMSEETLLEATRRLQQKNSPTLYAIGLMGNGLQSPGREALERLADATGGSAFFPENLDQVGDITRALAHDIRNQYTIAYKPQNQGANGQYHPILVQARAPGYNGLTVRTRTGYYTGESVR
jgi:Ca-activated chloride channel homolog